MFAYRETPRPATPGDNAGRSAEQVGAEDSREGVVGLDPRAHVRDVMQPVLLSAEEEKALAWRIAGEHCEASRERLIQGHLRVARAIAQKYEGRGLPLEELMGAATTGLRSATESFDPSQGARFSMEASWFVKHAIKHALANRAYKPVFFA